MGVARNTLDPVAPLTVKQFRALADVSLDPMMVVNTNGTIIDATRSIERLTGHRPEDVLGRSLSEFFSIKATTEDAVWSHLLGEVSVTKSSLRRNLSATRPDGRHVMCEATITPTQSPSHAERLFFVIVRDIADRAEADARMRFLSRSIDSISEAVVVTEKNGTIFFTNRAASELTGYSPHELLGQKPKLFKSGRHPKSFYEDMWQTVLSGRSWSGEVINKKRDGSLYDCHLTLAPVFDSDGEIEGFVAVQRDITEYKRLIENLETRNREILQLAYAMTHDLQTPLASLAGAVDALERSLPDGTDDAAARWLSVICQSVERMTSMLDDLMSYARSGSEEIKLKAIDVNAQIGQVIGDCAEASRRQNVVVRVVASIPALHGDERQIYRVFSNLIGNAIKYADLNKPSQVIISGTQAGAFVQFEIQDEGVGIDPRFLTDVLLPFKRANHKVKGSGLGLATVHRIITRHGGTIRLESDGVCGTTVIFSLPADFPRCTDGEEGAP